jgi:hypothetical protein
MNATAELELAPIEATPDAPLTLAALAVRPLSALEPTLLALSARYERVAYDLKTPKGLTDAKAARHDLRANGRYLVQNARDGFKKDAEAAKRAVEAEAERLIGLVKPREDALNTDIVAREAEIEAEKAEKARVERDRVEALRAGVERLLSYSDRAIGQPAEKIAQAITALEAMTFPEERWQEFAGRAAEARQQTVLKLLVLHGQALEAERLRAENERLQAEAAEQRRQAEELAAQRAESERLEALAVANRARIEAALTPPADRPCFVPQPTPATVTTPDGTVADAGTGEVLSPAFGASAAITPEYVAAQEALNTQARALLDAAAAPAPSLPAAGSDEPTVKLGDLCAKLGFTMTEAFVRDTLQIQPVPSKGRAVLIAEAALPALREALVSRVREVLAWEASA